MAAITFTSVTVELRTITCKCGGIFGVNERFMDLIYVEGGFYYCPYCQKGRGWNVGQQQREKESHEARMAEVQQRLRDANLQREIAEATAAKAQAAAGKAKKTLASTKHRVGNGVCPCCTRTFKQLQAHMKRKHPEYVSELTTA